jgi:hypothetical protein
MKLKLHRRAIAALALLAALAGAALVHAAWTAGGQGSGYVEAGTATPLRTLDASAETTATLYPGGTGDVEVEVDNPNPYPVTVTAISLRGQNGDIAPDASHSACDPTGVSFDDRTGLSLDVEAASSRRMTLSGAALMSNASADGCQGATFTIPLDLTGHSAAG